MLRRLLVLGLLLLTPPAATAAPVPYVADRAATTVNIADDFLFGTIKATVPLGRLHLALDVKNLRPTRLDFILRTRGAKASIPYATALIKGPRMLDAKNHPTITFHSKQAIPEGDATRIVGTVTIRGVTGPLTLEARFSRVPGRASGDDSQLDLRITGSFSRKAFGFTGWQAIVSDAVQLAISTRVDQKAPPPQQTPQHD